MVDQGGGNLAMNENKLIFRTRSMTTVIDYERCEPAKNSSSSPSCGFACIKADRMYDRNLLRIRDNKPVLAVPPETAQKASNESLSWEYACRTAGTDAIEIKVDFPDLDDYRKRTL